MIQEIIKNKGEVFLKRIGKSKLKVLKVEKGDKKAGPAIFYGVKLDNIIIS